MMGLQIFLQFFQNECLLLFRNRLDWFNPLLFFVLVISLFPLALTPDPQLLARLGSGIIWIAVLLAAMLSFDNLFNPDYEDGCLDQLLLSPCPLSLLILAKLLAHWLMNSLPLILLAFPLGLILYIPLNSLKVLLLTLCLGTPSLYLLGGIAAALTLGLKQRALLVILLLVPLYIPILIFATTAVTDYTLGSPILAHVAFLGAILTLCLAFAPIVIAAAIRVIYD